MYSVVTQQQSTSNRPLRQNAEKNATKDKKKRSLKDQLFQYVKRKFNPEPPEEFEDFFITTLRHRPEDISILTRQTHFTAKEIKLIYRGFKQECPTGLVDEDGFKKIFSQFFPLGDASGYAHFVFNTIKNKQGGNVTFEDFLHILSTVSRGSIQEKLSWVFSLYDVDGDGVISKSEMLQVVTAIYDMLGRCTAPAVSQTSPKEHVDRIFNSDEENKQVKCENPIPSCSGTNQDEKVESILLEAKEESDRFLETNLDDLSNCTPRLVRTRIHVGQHPVAIRRNDKTN